MFFCWFKAMVWQTICSVPCKQGTYITSNLGSMHTVENLPGKTGNNFNNKDEAYWSQSIPLTPTENVQYRRVPRKEQIQLQIPQKLSDSIRYYAGREDGLYEPKSAFTFPFKSFRREIIDWKGHHLPFIPCISFILPNGLQRLTIICAINSFPASIFTKVSRPTEYFIVWISEYAIYQMKEQQNCVFVKDYAWMRYRTAIKTQLELIPKLHSPTARPRSTFHSVTLIYMLFNAVILHDYIWYRLFLLLLRFWTLPDGV